MMGNTGETKQRQIFCCQYARLGDVEAAARLAGFPPETAAAAGAALLRQTSCQKLVRTYQMALQCDPAAAVCAGLRRLAFGRTNDAIQLVLAEEPPTPEQLQQLDLFSVSSIKRDKNGGMELHFFDRLKALSALYESSSDADGKAAAHALLAALSSGAAEGVEEDDV